MNVDVAVWDGALGGRSQGLYVPCHTAEDFLVCHDSCGQPLTPPFHLPLFSAPSSPPLAVQSPEGHHGHQEAASTSFHPPRIQVSAPGGKRRPQVWEGSVPMAALCPVVFQAPWLVTFCCPEVASVTAVPLHRPWGRGTDW